MSSSSDAPRFHHLPVLSQELISGLNLRPHGRYLDATVGAGGHSALILTAFPELQLTVLDQDLKALTAAEARLKPYGIERVEFVHTNFRDYLPPDTQFDGIIADLGVSSPQLDVPERGFSFQQTAPLDMRMNQAQSLTAEEIINHWREKDLADIFYHYGEERFSRKFARKIVENRPLHTTTELAELIWYAVPRQKRYGRIHPATRIFQALRIAVNEELTALETFLTHLPQLLAPAGRVGIISFHSLEDRRVKHFFRDCEELQVITKKPITATPEEKAQNPRSRSAKLRFAQRK